MQKFYFSAQRQPVEPLWVQCIYRSAQKNLWIRHWNSYFCLQFSVQTCTIITRKFRFRECYFIKPVKGLWQFISSFTGCKSRGTLVSKRQIHHIIKLVQNNVPYKVELIYSKYLCIDMFLMITVLIRASILLMKIESMIVEITKIIVIWKTT